MKKLLICLLLLTHMAAFSQTIMNIYQNNGTVLQIPLSTIDSITFTNGTPGNPATITTVAVTSIIDTSATSGGNISADGGSPVTHRGVCWGTAPNPTTANSKTMDGNGTGSFTSIISGLSANTTYYVRAYAINSAGTAYGNQLSFTTTAAVTIGSITSLNCASAVTTGSLTNGQAASGVSSAIPYTGGNGGAYSAQNVNSTGVTGLTAVLAAGNFANGNGTLTYTITGTSGSSGTASFALNIGGQTCNLTLNVSPAAGSISALNCGSAAPTGYLNNGQAASGVSAAVPYSGGNGGAYSAQNVNSTGVTGLTAVLAAGNFANGSGTLTYTITGTPTSGGTANFALNIGGQTCSISLNVLPGTAHFTGLYCDSAINSGTLTSGQAASGVSSAIPYTGGNGGGYGGQIQGSTGVTGLTATLSAGVVNNGNGVFTYVITGTPNGSGTASFTINVGGGLLCDLKRIVNPIAGTITNLNCGSAVNTGSLIKGQAASGVSSAIPYTGGNGGAYSAQNINSTGVTGLTAVLAAGTFANGSDTLRYTITGTPASTGTASFALNIGGKTCNLTLTVSPGPGTITALDCSGAYYVGVLRSGRAATDVSSGISYSGGNGGTYGAQSINSTGVTGLTASIAAGNFSNGIGTLVYTITGTPADTGKASFAINIGGKTCTLTRTVFNLQCIGNLCIGDNYQGGILAYFLQPGDAGYDAQVAHGLIVYPLDTRGIFWGCYGNYIGTTSKDLGTGAMNTSDMLYYCSDTSGAAASIKGLSLDGYTHYYLPSVVEFDKIYANLAANGLANFSSAVYWTSSEYDATHAWYFDINSGGAYYGGDKSNYAYIRPIRSF